MTAQADRNAHEKSPAGERRGFDRRIVKRAKRTVLGRPGSDLLSQVLRLSTIGAGEFNGRVRDGIGFRLPAITTRPAKNSAEDNQKSAHRDRYELSHTHVLSSAQAGRLVTRSFAETLSRLLKRSDGH